MISLAHTNKHITEFTKKETAKHGKGFYYKGQQFVHHSDLLPHETALDRLHRAQIVAIGGLLILLVISLLLNWHATVVAIFAGLIFVYFCDLLFNLYLIFKSFSIPPEIKITDAEIDAVVDKDWPKYTIFCPLYKEWEVLPQFTHAMTKLDYPKDKLQVMLLFEEDDVETIKNVRKMRLPKYFEIIIVPHSMPKTKPKACNYGLTLAKGEYSVIFDAEDIPETKQLKKAVLAFKKATKNTICIQAKLNFYNPHQNILTRVFTAEYALWFDIVLTGLQSINAPIPLGGTSNHFRTKDLHELKGWDAFNVTEDCDLGMRLVKHGYRTAMMDSRTMEEANSNMKNWFWQRTRWVKGYIQTYFVHMRNPRHFLKHWRDPHLAMFQLVIGGKIMSMIINPFLWVITISYFVFRPQLGAFIESFFPGPVLYMGAFCLVAGNFLYMYYYMIGCAKLKYFDIVKYVYLVPLYWVAMSSAAWVAIGEFVTNPYRWSKTKHGLHLGNAVVVAQTEEWIGRKLDE